MCRFQEEQQESRKQMVELLQRFGAEVKKVEELQRNQSATQVKEVVEESENEDVGTTRTVSIMTDVGCRSKTSEGKISKPPPLVYFSGVELIPKDEGSHDQWEFQVRGALRTHAENAVRAAIVNSLRGPARELVGFIGYTAPIEVIVEEIENRFGRKVTGDQLQQDFFKLAQEKNESVRVFAGRLEQTFRKLRDKFLERFDVTQLKERLFYRMSQGLRDSVRFLFKDSSVTYTKLLEVAEEAEGEWTEGKVNVRSKAATVKPDDNGLTDLKEKIDVLTTVVKSGNFQGARPKENQNGTGGAKPKNNNNNKPNSHSGAWSLPGSPIKGRGPGPSATGPFQKGDRPLQCYKCGGWGHTWKNCPMPGNLDWRSLTARQPPRVEEAGTSNQRKQ